MKNNYSIAERNRIVEENLHWIDKIIQRNAALMRAAHLDYDDVYQDLAIRLIQCVENFDPERAIWISTSCASSSMRCSTARTAAAGTALPLPHAICGAR